MSKTPRYSRIDEGLHLHFLKVAFSSKELPRKQESSVYVGLGQELLKLQSQ